MTAVRVSTATHSVTHVTTNILWGLRRIVRDCGLDQTKISSQWEVLEAGTAAWLASGHLRGLVLEVYDPRRAAGSDLVGRFDFTIDYGYYPDGDGDLWLDPDTVAFAIRRAGTYPSACDYRFVADTAPGRPPVDGWSDTAFRSTAGMTRQTLGTGIGGGGIGTSLSYYRRTS
jgi:Bacterial HORMA domain 2